MKCVIWAHPCLEQVIQLQTQKLKIPNRRTEVILALVRALALRGGLLSCGSGRHRLGQRGTADRSLAAAGAAAEAEPPAPAPASRLRLITAARRRS